MPGTAPKIVQTLPAALGEAIPQLPASVVRTSLQQTLLHKAEKIAIHGSAIRRGK